MILKARKLVFSAQLDHNPTVFGVLFASLFLAISHLIRELSGPHISSSDYSIVAASFVNINFSPSLFCSHFGGLEVRKEPGIALCLTQPLHLEAIRLSLSLFA